MICNYSFYGKTWQKLYFLTAKFCRYDPKGVQREIDSFKYLSTYFGFQIIR